MVESEVITSPHFPDKYANNMYEIWSIRAPPDFHIQMSIIIFDTERNSDYLYIGYGASEWSFNSESWISLSGTFRDVWKSKHTTFNSSIITFIFTSDGDNTEVGFHIELYGIRQKEHITTENEASTLGSTLETTEVHEGTAIMFGQFPYSLALQLLSVLFDIGKGSNLVGNFNLILRESLGRASWDII